MCFVSRTLSKFEGRYSQTEKEALALIWECGRFHLYVYGLLEFALFTDHLLKQVQTVTRIEYWMLRLQSYKYKVSLCTFPEEYCRRFVKVNKDSTRGTVSG